MSKNIYKNIILSSVEYNEQLNFWLNKLSGIEPINLLSDHILFDEKGGDIEVYDMFLPTHINDRIISISKDSEFNIFTLLMAAFKCLLYRYTASKDITVYSPPLKSDNSCEYNNLIPLRSFINDKLSFKEILIAEKASNLESYKNQNYPLEVVLERLNLMSGNSCSSTELCFSLENIHDGNSEITKRNFDIWIKWTRENGKITGQILFNSARFKRNSIAHLYITYQNILNYITSNINVKLSDLAIVTEEEKRLLLRNFNGSERNYPVHKTIHELFEEQVKKSPDRIAVVFGNESLTFFQLSQKSNQVARILRNNGIQADDIVAIMTERSLEMLIGIVGIIKAGAAYLPIDPMYPDKRKEYMLQDSGAKMLLTQPHLNNKIHFKGDKVNLDNHSLYGCDDSNAEALSNPNHLIYVIYTSGTSGNPKGVMVENRNLVNLVYALKEEIFDEYSSHLNLSLVTPYIFDASVKQIFPSLLLGHTLFIVPEELRFNSELLLKFYEENSINIADGTPMHLNAILEHIDINSCHHITLDTFVIGGEQLQLDTVKRFQNKFSSKTNIINVYGPTECCDVTTIYKVNTINKNCLTRIPIGKPIANSKVYIVDSNLNIQPIGVPGELCIGGAGLTRGYLNRSELTTEKFIDNPFVLGEKMYRTGDLVRWLPAGNIEFLGRIDQQVKIRGFRIELEEIEARLLTHESIKEAVVIAREEQNETKYLCAYIVAERNLTITELREYLFEDLPEYMVPTYFIKLDNLPVTVNGKIDRKGLPVPKDVILAEMKYEAPGNEMEKKMVGIWSEVLDIDSLGINDNFFELGGHSLKAVSIIAKLNKLLDIDLNISDLFRYTTIKGLGKYIKGLEKKKNTQIEKVEEKEYYPLSSAQKRMYILSQFDIGSINYNIPSIFTIEGDLNKDRLEKALNLLIDRHESFRTYFEVENNQIKQKISKAIDFKLECIESDMENLDAAIKLLIKPFNLAQAPILRASLIRIDDYKHVFVLDIHHIISDGVSMGIFFRDLNGVYEGKKLPELRIQYKDYAEWQNRITDSKLIAEQEKYWLEMYEGEIPLLNLPTDYARSKVKSYKGAMVVAELSPNLTSKICEITRVTGTTLNMVLLATFNILLSKYSGQDDIIVGTISAGRKLADLENVIGMFVNTLALRSQPEGEKTFKEFLEEVRECTLKAYENQDYQLEELVDKLNISRDISRNPLFDIMFVMQNISTYELKLHDLIVKPYSYQYEISKFDIILTATEGIEDITIAFEYCSELFHNDTIQRFARDYKKILTTIAEDICLKIKNISLLDEEQLGGINSEMELLDEFLNLDLDF